MAGLNINSPCTHKLYKISQLHVLEMLKYFSTIEENQATYLKKVISFLWKTGRVWGIS